MSGRQVCEADIKFFCRGDLSSVSGKVSDCSAQIWKNSKEDNTCNSGKYPYPRVGGLLKTREGRVGAKSKAKSFKGKYEAN